MKKHDKSFVKHLINNILLNVLEPICKTVLDRDDRIELRRAPFVLVVSLGCECLQRSNDLLICSAQSDWEHEIEEAYSLGWFAAQVLSKDENPDGFRTQNGRTPEHSEGWAMMESPSSTCWEWWVPRVAAAKAQTDKPQEGDRLVDTQVFLSPSLVMSFNHMLMCL